MKVSDKDEDPLVPRRKTTIKTGSCCSSRCLVLTVGVLSVMLSMMVLLPSLYLLVSEKAWNMVRKSCHDWLEQNHWDMKVLINDKVDIDEEYYTISGDKSSVESGQLVGWQP